MMIDTPFRTYRRNRGPTRPVILVLVLLASCVVNISLVVLMFKRSTGGVQYQDVHTPTGNVGKGVMCVHCGSGVTREGYLSDVDVLKLNGKKMVCCLEHDGGLVHMMKLFLGQYGKINILMNGTGDDNGEDPYIRPSAHLFLDQNAFIDVDVPGDAMKWSVEPGYNTAHVTGAMQFVNDSLHIQEDGFYFVYTSVTLSTPYDSNDVIMNHVTHSVTRHSSERSGNLFSRTSLLPNTLGYFTTSCLEGNIYLRSGDVINVHLSNYSFLYKFSISNYFGIYRL